MKHKFKLTLITLTAGFLFLNACSDKKKYLEIVKEDSEVTKSDEKLELPEVSDVDEVRKENEIVRGEDGVVIGGVILGKPGYMINPFTNAVVDVRGVPAGTKVRDPHDPNPDHVMRVPQAAK